MNTWQTIITAGGLAGGYLTGTYLACRVQLGHATVTQIRAYRRGIKRLKKGQQSERAILKAKGWVK